MELILFYHLVNSTIINYSTINYHKIQLDGIDPIWAPCTFASHYAPSNDGQAAWDYDGDGGGDHDEDGWD